MKRRILRPSIEKLLIAIDTLLIMFVIMIDDFEISAIPLIALIIITIITLTHIIRKYGKTVI